MVSAGGCPLLAQSGHPATCRPSGAQWPANGLFYDDRRFAAFSKMRDRRLSWLHVLRDPASRCALTYGIGTKDIMQALEFFRG